MIFWHTGATVALARYTFRDDRMDLRFLVLGALLPDVIDTGVGAMWFGSFGSVRLWGHTLLASAGVMVIVLLRTRRGRPRKRWMPVAIGMLLHLILDGMWQDSETLLWPFLGFEFTQSEFDTFGALTLSTLKDWRVWVLEAVGFAYLVVLGKQAGLQHGPNRKQLRENGVVHVPIERHQIQSRRPGG